MTESAFRRFGRLAALMGALGSAPLWAQTGSTSGVTASETGGESPVVLPSFEVSTSQDQGYRPGNSVSGTRIDTPIMDLPFAINAFTQQFMADINSRDLFDVAQYAPGVTNAARNYTGGDALYTVRGFLQAPQRNGFATPNSGTLIGPNVDTDDVERVEVIKGPASVLYGQIAPGGTVNYVTKKPEENPFVVLNLQGGSYNFARTQIDVNQPVMADKLLVRLNSSWENDFQYIQPGKSQTAVFDPAITYKPNDRVTLMVDFEWMHRHENPQDQNLPLVEVTDYPGDTKSALASPLDSSDTGTEGYFPNLPANFNLASANDLRTSDYETFDAELDIKLTDHWVSRLNFTWFKDQIAYKFTGAFFVYAAPPGSSKSAPATTAQEQAFAAELLANIDMVFTAPDPVTMYRRQVFQEAFGNGATLQWEAAGTYEFSWGDLKPLVGAFENETVSWSRARQAPTGEYFPSWDMLNPATWNHNTNFDPTTIPIITFTRSLTVNKAAYAVLDADFLNHRLFTVLGLRYNEADAQTINFIPTPVKGPKFTASKVDPQVGVGYKLMKDLMWYANYSTSFQQNAAFNEINSVPSGPAQPTTSNGYETGIKTDFMNGRVSSTISVYDIYQYNRVASFNTVPPNGQTTTTTVQGTEDRSRGIEAEITYSPTDAWQIYTSVAEDDVRSIKLPAGYDFYLGAHPEASAKTLGNLWTRYSFTRGPIRGLWIGGGFNYNGKKAMRVNNPNLFLPAYTLWNSVVGYDWTWRKTKMTWAANWNNMTNVNYSPATQDRGLPDRVVTSITAKF